MARAQAAPVIGFMGSSRQICILNVCAHSAKSGKLVRRGQNVAVNSAGHKINMIERLLWHADR
jgi:hypothetical protein